MAYTIQKGDTLSQIAANNKTTVSAIQALNPSITNPNVIYAGQTLNLPNTSTTTYVQSPTNPNLSIPKTTLGNTTYTPNSGYPVFPSNPYVSPSNPVPGNTGNVTYPPNVSMPTPTPTTPTVTPGNTGNISYLPPAPKVDTTSPYVQSPTNPNQSVPNPNYQAPSAPSASPSPVAPQQPSQPPVNQENQNQNVSGYYTPPENFEAVRAKRVQELLAQGMNLAQIRATMTAEGISPYQGRPYISTDGHFYGLMGNQYIDENDDRSKYTTSNPPPGIAPITPASTTTPLTPELTEESTTQQVIDTLKTMLPETDTELKAQLKILEDKWNTYTQTLGTARETSGLTAAEKEVADTEAMLDALEGNLAKRTSGTWMNEAQRSRELYLEQKPLQERLTERGKLLKSSQQTYADMIANAKTGIEMTESTLPYYKELGSTNKAILSDVIQKMILKQLGLDGGSETDYPASYDEYLLAGGEKTGMTYQQWLDRNKSTSETPKAPTNQYGTSYTTRFNQELAYLYAGKYGTEGAREKVLKILKAEFPNVDVAKDVYVRIPDGYEAGIKTSGGDTTPDNPFD